MRIKKPKFKISQYNPSKIESKWQQVWNKNRIYSPSLDTAKRPFYNLMMFPYPSASGMHVGNMYAFTGADVYGRFMRMQGYDVFEPIGLDGFGIHSENYAIKVGRHPKEQAKISEANFYRQLYATGNGFDRSRKLETYDPKYYKWTQWLFIQLFKAGLAYRKMDSVYFCPSCKTVLADEQVIEGRCERCSSLVKKRNLEQWFFKITNYAEKLLSNIDKLNWTEKVKTAQRDWIGKSEGARIKFKIKGSHHELEVFTTRSDTIFGATFLVVAPEHPLISNLFGIGQKIMNYLSGVLIKKKEERGKEGVDTEYKAINPATEEEIPIWISEYVVMDYGTGAIMAVPAHDKRDHEFAIKYKLPIRKVIDPHNEFQSLVMKKSVDPRSFIEEIHKNHMWITPYYDWGFILTGRDDQQEKYISILQRHLKKGAWYVDSDGSLKAVIFKDKIFRLPDNDLQARQYARAQGIPEGQLDWQSEENYAYCFTGHGTIVNSGELSGLKVPMQISRVLEWLEEKGIGKSEVTYHLRDWLISRQRYWGPPIPMIYCEICAKNGNSGFTSTKKSSTKEDYLVNLKADSLDGWPDTLKGNISKQNKDINDWNSAGWFPVPEKDLPVLLPDVKDWKPTGTGKSPLANVESFVNIKCPNCESPAKRETDVSDNFLDSAWYFFRYLATDIDSTSFDIERVKLWLPVNMYIGGAEHSVLHLLYSRFITMALNDLGFIGFEEPFSRFYAHGLLIKQGAKMSKSRGNVVIPDEYIKKYGADTLRCYLMFLGPFSQGGDFYDTGIEGMHRFIKRVWRLINKSQISNLKSQMSNERLRIMHKTIKKVTEDISSLRYNTAIASLMEWYNFLSAKCKVQSAKLSYEEVESFLKLMAPFAPHMTEELFQQFFRNSKFHSIHLQSWPKYDPKFLEEQEATIVVQVDGKVRDTFKVQSSKFKVQSYVEELVRKSKRVNKYLQEKSIKKVVYVEGKVVNFVTE